MVREHPLRLPGEQREVAKMHPREISKYSCSNWRRQQEYPDEILLKQAFVDKIPTRRQVMVGEMARGCEWIYAKMILKVVVSWVD